MSDFTVEIDQEEDRRWIGEVVNLPGVLTYGGSRDEVVAKAKALAFRVLADRLEYHESVSEWEGCVRCSGINWSSTKASVSSRLIDQVTQEPTYLVAQ